MSRRRTTVHDAAALRLHPSGVRVNDAVQNAARSVVTVKTKGPQISRRLPGGNWIATDAGGDGKVTKRRKINGRKVTDIEAGNITIADSQDEMGAATQGQLEDMPVKVHKDTRAIRRVEFENDLTFLAAPDSFPKGNTSDFQPSSDFLKCIHYFASQFYGSRGQLFDSAGDYRKVKKENRRKRRLASGSQDPDKSQNRDGSEVEEEQVEEKQTKNDIPSKELLPTADSTRGRKGKQKVESETRKIRRDMYQAFDGSALLCIGTLLQSHIVSSLADNMPGNWESDSHADGSEGSHGATESGSPKAPLEEKN